MNRNANIRLFCTANNTGVVAISDTFILQHLDNGVVPRLLGFARDDGLTEPRPSTNAEGHHTILAQLGIESTPLLHLLQFFRLGSVPPAHRQSMYEVSLRLGGFEKLDQYMRGQDVRETEQARAPPSPCQLPSQDTRGQYQWTLCNSNHSTELMQRAQDGWSVTDGPGPDSYHVYLRKPCS